MRTTTQTSFGTPSKRRDRLSRERKGRRCSQADCPTLLSAYNTSDACWVHATPATRHPLARD